MLLTPNFLWLQAALQSLNNNYILIYYHLIVLQVQYNDIRQFIQEYAVCHFHTYFFLLIHLFNLEDTYKKQKIEHFALGYTNEIISSLRIHIWAFFYNATFHPSRVFQHLMIFKQQDRDARVFYNFVEKLFNIQGSIFWNL